MITDEVKRYIDKCVLCWLGTSDEENMPNVSPKEVFTYQDDSTLLIAHIASPVSVQNILQNPNVCVSFVDVFVQKGFKLKGTARIIATGDNYFDEKVKPLAALFTEDLPIQAVIEITVTKIDRIIAPGYYLFAGATEESQTASAMKAYNVQPRQI